jgi:hypothetical protein
MGNRNAALGWYKTAGGDMAWRFGAFFHFTRMGSGLFVFYYDGRECLHFLSVYLSFYYSIFLSMRLYDRIDLYGQFNGGLFNTAKSEGNHLSICYHTFTAAHRSTLTLPKSTPHMQNSPPR